MLWARQVFVLVSLRQNCVLTCHFPHVKQAGPTEVVKPIIPAPRATDEAAAKAAAAKFEASLAEMSAGGGAPPSGGADHGSHGRGRGHRNHAGAGSGAGSGRPAPGGGRHGRWGEEKTGGGGGGGGGGIGSGNHSSDDEHGGGKHGEGKTDWHTSPAAAAGRGKQFANTSSGRAAAANHAAYLAARSEKRNLGREFDAQSGPRRGSRGHQRAGIAAGVDDGGDGGYRGRFHHQPSPKAQPARFGRRARPSGGKDADDGGHYDGHSTAATSALQGPAVGSLGQRQRRGGGGGGGRGGGMGGGYTHNNGSLSARASTQGRSDGDAFDVGGLDSPLSSVSGSPRVDGLADVGGATPMSSLFGRHGAATRTTAASAAAPAPAAAAFGRRSNANGRRGYGRRRTDASDGRVTMDRLAPGGGGSDRDRGGGNSDILARIKNLGSSFEDVSYEFDDATLGSRGFR